MSEWPTTLDPEADLEPRLAAPVDDGPDADGANTPARRGIAPLTRILRVIGAVALLASASTFMMQRWEEGGDLWRYFTLLAHPALVAAIGIYCGTQLRDTKSARTFLAVAAAFIPVLSCILGGLLLSQFASDGVLSQLPRYATWVADGRSSALTALAVSAAVAIPVIGVAFLTLARSQAWPMALAYGVGNAALLLPTRDPEVVTLIAGTTFLGLVYAEWRTFSRDAALRTLEGGFVRTMLMAPPVLMMIRSALHYDLSAAWFSAVFGAAAIGLLATSLWTRLDEALQGVARFLSVIHLSIAAAFATDMAVSFGLAGTYALPFGALVFSLGVTTFSLLSGTERWGEQFRMLAGLSLLGALTLDLMLSPDVLTSAACFSVSVITVCLGYLNERRPLFFAGIAGVVFSLAFHVRAAVMLYAYGRFGSLALLGIAVILIAGYLDRNGHRLAPRFREFRERVAAW
jgi:hypothetical protein